MVKKKPWQVLLPPKNPHVFKALERNFGGLKKEDFLQLTEVFFRHLEKETDGLIAPLETSSLRGILDVLQEALEDLPPEDLQEFEWKGGGV